MKIQHVQTAVKEQNTKPDMSKEKSDKESKINQASFMSNSEEKDQISVREEELKKQILGEDNPLAAGVEWKSLRFRRHVESDRVIVDVINRNSGEVIKTVPEEELMDVLTKLKEIAGLTINITG